MVASYRSGSSRRISPSCSIVELEWHETLSGCADKTMQQKEVRARGSGLLCDGRFGGFYFRNGFMLHRSILVSEDVVRRNHGDPVHHLAAETRRGWRICTLKHQSTVIIAARCFLLVFIIRARGFHIRTIRHGPKIWRIRCNRLARCIGQSLAGKSDQSQSQ